MLLELDKYVEEGCVVTILAPVPVEERTALPEEEIAAAQAAEHQLEHAVGPPSIAPTLRGS